MTMNFASAASRKNASAPSQPAFRWSAQDLADAVPLRLFEAVDFDALAQGGIAASNANAPRAWRRRYADAGALPAQVRVR
jgi:hypothetical protein